MEKLLKAKQDKKAANPSFTRADSHKKRRLNEGWRRPKGLHNKMRLRKKGYKDVVKTGHGTPSALRGKDATGKAITAVSTLAELEALDPKTQAALLANTGRKKKEQLIEAAKKKGLAITNLPVAAYQERTKALLKEKEDKKRREAERQAAKDKKLKEAEKRAAKKAEEAAKDEAAKSDEEKKQEAKKEQDKVLTSKKGM
ncbi:hypothetical protein JXA12_02635 [Candidatus Woesearchaeota archaeon]|nr:hypothetical protein [Candidatus Woesearchaeota archaeon]